jgi:hypothetical protein
MRLLTFVLNALWEEACRIENESSFHSFGPEYVKVFLKSSVFAFGICNFSLTTLSWESKDFYQTCTGFYFLNMSKNMVFELLVSLGIQMVKY